MWRPKPSGGGRLGLAISAALAALGLTGVLLGVTQQHGIIDLLLVTFGFCAGLGAAIVGLWALGYRSLRYVLTPGALVVQWLGRDEVVPLLQVDGVYAGQRLGRLPRLRGLGWPGYRVGRASHKGADLVCFATSSAPADLTLIVTARGSYALSPEDGVGFRQELIRRAEAEIDEVPPARSSRRARAALGLLDELNLGLLAAGLLVALLVLSRYMLGIATLPDQAVLHFSTDGTADAIGPRSELIVLPLLALGGWLVSAVAGLLLLGQAAGAARLIWLGNLAAGAITLVAALRLIP